MLLVVDDPCHPLSSLDRQTGHGRSPDTTVIILWPRRVHRGSEPSIKMRTIYADFNDFQADGALPLTCAGSISSIASLSGPIKEGEEVWLSDGTLWVIARVSYGTDGNPGA